MDKISLDDIEKIKEWLTKQLHLPKISDAELALFLHSNYNRIEPTKTNIDRYYTVRTHYDFFVKRNVQTEKNLQEALHVVLYTVLPDVTPDNRKIIFAKIVDNDSNRYNFGEGIKALCMVLDVHLSELDLIDGYVIVFDMNGTTFGHVTKLNPVLAKKFIYYLQEALPIRLKEIHFFNIVPYLDTLMSIIKPLMKMELLELMQFHKTADSLFEVLPRKLFPKDYGGNAKDIKTLISENYQLLVNNENWFINDETSRRVNENCRSGNSIKGNAMFGVEGTFKRLQDID